MPRPRTPFKTEFLLAIARPLLHSSALTESLISDDTDGLLGGIGSLGVLSSGAGGQAVQAARRRTSQTVAAMSSTDSASSQPPSIHWKGQNRLAG